MVQRLQIISALLQKILADFDTVLLLLKNQKPDQKLDRNRTHLKNKYKDFQICPQYHKYVNNQSE